MMATELEKCSQFSSVHCDVGAHLLSRIQFSVTPWAATARLLCPWDFPSKHTGVGCCCLLQGIFPTQGLNQHLLHLQADSLPLIHQGSSTMERY